MATGSFPRSLGDRTRWALKESLLIAAIFLFWLGIGTVILILFAVVALVIQAFQIEQLRFVYQFVSHESAIWTVLTPLATASIGLYVLVRAGTILIDRYQSSPDE